MSIDPYLLIIGASIVIIMSYLFNVLSKSTNIPSVLLLIVGGLCIREFSGIENLKDLNVMPALNILGIVGLILIVLEAALDLKLERRKAPMIFRSFLVALIVLLVSSFAVAYILYNLLGIPYYNALIYAVPISIMSSAITIPSVHNLIEDKREFMIYESTFSDILGIIFFYFLIDSNKPSNPTAVSLELLGNILLTIVIAVVVTYAILYVLQRITTRFKLFLSFAILLLIYAVGKMMHLSSLIFILIFGVILNNQDIFVRGFIRRFIQRRFMVRIVNDFKFMTAETAFVVRTFFFVVFGMSISLSSLNTILIYEISVAILIALYLIRYFNLKMVMKSEIFPELYIAPRGLITVLLFFSIPETMQHPGFDSGILFVVILASSLIMMFGLIASGRKMSETVIDRQVDGPFLDNSDFQEQDH